LEDEDEGKSPEANAPAEKPKKGWQMAPEAKRDKGKKSDKVKKKAKKPKKKG